MGRLKTTRVLWWLQRLDKDQHGGFLSAGLGLGHNDFDGYRGWLRSSRVLWWLQGLAGDDKYGFCGLKGSECQ